MQRRVVGGLLALTFAGPVAAQPATLTLATATPGGGFPAYGDAFVAALATAEPGLTVTPRNTAGSTANVPLLREGAVDLGLVAGEVATAALRGAGAPSILAAMYGTPGLFVVRGDSPHRDIAALRGLPVAWGARGSNFVVLARQVMGGLGLDIERDFTPVFLDRAGDGPAMVLDGRVAALWGGGAGWPGFRTVAAAPGGARFLAPDAAQRARILASDPGLRPMALPAGSYPGQDAAIESVGIWAYVLARPGLPEEVGYRLARALHRAGPDLATRLPQAAETTPANTVAAAPDPAMIHPGVRRYLREIGALAPA